MNTDKRRLFSHLKAFDFPLCNAVYSVVKAFDCALPHFSHLTPQISHTGGANHDR